MSSLAVWDHIALPGIQHKWAHLTLTPARQTGTWFTYQGGMEVCSRLSWIFINLWACWNLYFVMFMGFGGLSSCICEFDSIFPNIEQNNTLSVFSNCLVWALQLVASSLYFVFVQRLYRVKKVPCNVQVFNRIMCVYPVGLFCIRIVQYSSQPFEISTVSYLTVWVLLLCALLRKMVCLHFVWSTIVGSLPPFRLSKPAISGGQPLVTPIKRETRVLCCLCFLDCLL